MIENMKTLSIKSKAESKEFYKGLAIIVAPIAIQNLISSACNSLDVVMLGSVGQTAIAATSLANQVQFILMLFFVGLGSGLSMLTSQYWGKKDYASIQILMGTALRISCAAGFIFCGATFFFPKAIMALITNEPQLIEVGSLYLRTVSLAYFLLSVSQVYHAVLKSTEHVKTVTIITFIALGLNLLLNAIFIYGLFGVEKMGIFGVAIATVIARSIELVICIVFSLRVKEVRIRITNIFLRSKLLSKDFIVYSLPAVGNEFVWGAAFATYSVILGHLGEDIVAANSVVNVVRNLASILCFGMAYGGAILLGKQIGEGDLEKVKRNGKRLIKSTVLAGFISALCMIALQPLLPHIARLSDVASGYRNYLLYINSYSLLGATINTVLICGIFRAGGDAKFGFILDTIAMWVVSIPLGLIAAFVLKLSPLAVYFILYLDEFEKMPIVIAHYFKGNWLKDITR